MNADRPGTQVETWRDQIVGSFHPEHAEHGRAALDSLLAALDAAEQRVAEAKAEADRLAADKWLAEKERDEAQTQHRAARADSNGYKARWEAAEKERDEWQELAVRLAEEAGVDAEQMLTQARAENKP